MHKKVSLVVAASLMQLMGTLYAETVAWYRFDDGVWHHIAFVFDADTLTMTGYVDYKQVASAVAPSKEYSGSGDITLSGENSGYQSFAGCLDEVRITRRALGVRDFLTTRPVPEGTLMVIR